MWELKKNKDGNNDESGDYILNLIWRPQHRNLKNKL